MKRKTLRKSLAVILSLILAMSVIIQNVSLVYGENHSFDVITVHPNNHETYNVTIPDIYEVISVENTLDKNKTTYIDFKLVNGQTVTGWVYGTAEDNSNIVEYIKDGNDAGKYRFKLKVNYIKNNAPELDITSPTSDKRFINSINIKGTVNDSNIGETIKLFYLIEKSNKNATPASPSPTFTPIPNGLSENELIDKPFNKISTGEKMEFNCYVPIDTIDDGEYNLLLWAEDGIHKFPDCIKHPITFIKDTKSPGKPIIKITPSDKYAQNVTVEFKAPESSYKTLRVVYKKEHDPDFQEFSTPFLIDNNQTVSAMCYDIVDGKIVYTSKIGEYSINNIDRTPPEKPTIELKSPEKVKDDTIKFIIRHGKDNTKANVRTQYNYDGTWKDYEDKNSLTVIETNGVSGKFTIKAKTIDEAGNESLEATREVHIESTVTATPIPSTAPVQNPGTSGGGGGYVYIPAVQSTTPIPSAVTEPVSTMPIAVPTPTPIPVPADLGVFLTSDKTAYEENSTVAFSVYYNNKLGTTAEKVVVKAEIPQNTTVVDAAKGTVSGNTISWDIGSLNGKATGEIIFKIKLGALSASEVNMSSKATISSANQMTKTDDDESIFNFMGFSKKIAGKPHTKFINGYENKQFRPENMITRAEVAKILVTALSLTKAKDTGKKFKDVDNKHWAYDYIVTAVNSGIFSGYNDGTFLPNKAITRAELSTALAKYLKLKNIEPAKVHFKDINTHWAKNFIEEIYRSKLIAGYSDGSFKPDAQIKRSECVTIICRLLNRGPLKDADCGFVDVNKTHWAYGYIAEGSLDHSYTRNSDGSETKKK